MKKRIKSLTSRGLKRVRTINLTKLKKILLVSKTALELEKKKSIAHLRWLADFKLRHKLDMRNRKLFRNYVSFFKKLKKYETKHSRELLIIKV